MSKYQDSIDGIAIIGMSGRFPGAKNIEQFWNNLKNGVESITFFTKEDALACGVSEEHLNDPNYVLAGGILDDVELFDAAFFGFNPREAATMDPQQRLFLECAYEALENAGYALNKYDFPVGVYAGANMSTYFLYHLINEIGVQDDFALAIANDKDYLATRVSYQFNFKGPSITVQTACSTSLTAVAMACEGLLNYHCDMALAGGAAVKLPQKMGYLYQPGMIASPDGHTRPFDAKAEGTVFTSAVGVVVLKRLEDALRDGDRIDAVIRGIAVNNDGSDKVGFTAPSREGQAEVIAAAQNLAGIDPEEIGYLEMHGTGTALGDPIEVAALTNVFRERTQRKAFCAIGSVKGNIGHAVSGAGIAGLIKTVLALKHKQIPPSINFAIPNGKIDWETSPFYINTRLTAWESNGNRRIAGVSSFGFGGTNVHAVLEEAPIPQRSSASNDWQLLTLSAKTHSALEKICHNLAEFFRDHPEVNFSDAVYTLHVGRKEFEHRIALLCRNREEAIKLLETWPNGGPTVYAGMSRNQSGNAREIEELIATLSSNPKSKLTKLGKLWVAGATIDWEAFYKGEKRLRVPLPPYPFERKRHWVEQYHRKESLTASTQKTARSGERKEWVYFPSWKRATSLRMDEVAIQPEESWLVFTDQLFFHQCFIDYLKKKNIKVITVGKADRFQKIDDSSFLINPGAKENYRALLDEISKTGRYPRKILHLWNVTPVRSGSTRLEAYDQGQEDAFYSLLYLVQSLEFLGIKEKIRISIITNGLYSIAGESELYPEKATVLGPCKVIPKEYPDISCQSIDILLPEEEPQANERLIEMILAEITAGEPEFIVAIRESCRWLQFFEVLKVETKNDTSPIREGATYLITGGLGGLGLAIAGYLAEKARVKLVLTRRSFFPDKQDWNRWLSSHSKNNKTSTIIKRLMMIENSGSEIMTASTDVSDPEQMGQLIRVVERSFGKVDGVIHAAGIADNSLISEKTGETAAKVLSPKVKGVLVLDELFKGRQLDFMVLFSSSSAVLGNAGFVDYCAANNFLDAYAHFNNRLANYYTVAINWDEWAEAGMAAESKARDRVKNKISLKQGLAWLDKIITLKPAAQVIVSPGDFLSMLENIREYLLVSWAGEPRLEAVVESNRPELPTPYVGPNNQTEAAIAEIWQRLLGVYPVGVNDDFFELGGHSLLAISFLSELAKEFQKNISLQNLYEKATVAELAAMLNEELPDEESLDYEEGQI